MKGKNFLKVTGILMIIFGGIGLILSLVALMGVMALADLGVSSTILTVAALFSVASAALQLVAGIIGVKDCNKAEAAKKCMSWGIIVAALCVIGQIINVIGGASFDVVSLLIGLVLPVLYIIGAAKNTAA